MAYSGVFKLWGKSVAHLFCYRTLARQICGTLVLLSELTVWIHHTHFWRPFFLSYMWFLLCGPCFLFSLVDHIQGVWQISTQQARPCVIGSSGWTPSSCVTVHPPWLQQAPHFHACLSGLSGCCRSPTAKGILSRRLTDTTHWPPARRWAFVDTSQMLVRLCSRTLARHACGTPVFLRGLTLQLVDRDAAGRGDTKVVKSGL